MSRNSIRYNGYRIDYRAYQRTAFDRVRTGFGTQQFGLETNEVGLVGFYIGNKVVGVVRAGIRVRVFAFGQEQHFDVDAFFQNHVYTSYRRVNTCRIAVVEDCNAVGETVQEFDLGRRQCSASAGYYIGDAGLVHRDNVHLAFYQVSMIEAGYRLLGLEEAEQLVMFLKQRRGRRVDILTGFVTFLEQSSGKTHYLARLREEGEDDARMEAVVQTAVFGFETHTGAHKRCILRIVKQVFLCKTVLHGLFAQQALVRRVANLKLMNGLILQSSLAQVSQSYGLSLAGVPQLFLEPLIGPFVHHKH